MAHGLADSGALAKSCETSVGDPLSCSMDASLWSSTIVISPLQAVIIVILVRPPASASASQMTDLALSLW